jgi:sigma-B regulation protein RsbU (phosphoserine phosphatase)
MPRKRPARPAPAATPVPPEASLALEAALRANATLEDELRRAKQQLSLRAYELHNLVDLTRDLTGSSAEEAIREIVLTTVMGHFVVSRSALYLVGPDGLALASARGLRRDASGAAIPPRALAGLAGPRAVAELPPGPLRDQLQAARLALAVPLAAADRTLGVLAIGERASGLPFSEEDRDVAQTLARQALAAIENVRLQRVRDQKQRQDRELQVAREIQRSLFPSREPELRGFQVAGESRPCYEVGGDAYDWIPLPSGRLAVVVADVAGKGTPASLLMASVHAHVHALAGTLATADAISRLNRFLYARTQASRFVTLFYAELDPGSRRLAYVNAGHVPGYAVASSGTLRRLKEGGPALGLIPDATYDVGETTLEPGELAAFVTDGVTEAMSPEESEFGDDRVCETLRSLSGGSATAVLAGLVAAVSDWSGARGASDDLTAVILKAR